MSGRVKKKKKKKPSGGGGESRKKKYQKLFPSRRIFQRQISAENIVIKPATLNDPAHEKTKHVCIVDIQSAIGPKFSDAFTIICTADLRITQLFKDLKEDCREMYLYPNYSVLLLKFIIKKRR